MSDIGYWIDPDGMVHFVRHGSHHQWMRRHRGMSDAAAEESGWHRVRIVGCELFSYGAVNLTVVQEEAVRRLMTEYRAAHHRECTVIR